MSAPSEEQLDVCLRAISGGFLDDLLRRGWGRDDCSFRRTTIGTSEDREAVEAFLGRLREIVPELRLTSRVLSPSDVAGSLSEDAIKKKAGQTGYRLWQALVQRAADLSS